jgi:hypothetical protein
MRNVRTVCDAALASYRVRFLPEPPERHDRYQMTVRMVVNLIGGSRTRQELVSQIKAGLLNIEQNEDIANICTAKGRTRKGRD